MTKLKHFKKSTKDHENLNATPTDMPVCSHINIKKISEMCKAHEKIMVVYNNTIMADWANSEEIKFN